MAKSWHKKHISTKWGIVIIIIMLIAIGILIPVLSQSQNILSNAMYYNEGKIFKKQNTSSYKKPQQAAKGCRAIVKGRTKSGVCLDKNTCTVKNGILYSTLRGTNGLVGSCNQCCIY